MPTMKIQAWLYRPGKNVSYLLLLRKEERGGYWTPITGHVEKGEKLMDALYREVKEETGIADPEYVIDLRVPYRFAKDGEEFEEHSFGVQVETDSVVLSPEHQSFEWLTYEAALQRLRWNEQKNALQVLHDMIDV
ncbi:MAG: NUDIX domain-containing protein [Methanomassiliicoccales archaeon]